jgi:hypothetical protein
MQTISIGLEGVYGHADVDRDSGLIFIFVRNKERRYVSYHRENLWHSKPWTA